MGLLMALAMYLFLMVTTMYINHLLYDHPTWNLPREHPDAIARAHTLKFIRHTQGVGFHVIPIAVAAISAVRVRRNFIRAAIGTLWIEPLIALFFAASVVFIGGASPVFLIMLLCLPLVHGFIAGLIAKWWVTWIRKAQPGGPPYSSPAAGSESGDL